MNTEELDSRIESNGVEYFLDYFNNTDYSKLDGEEYLEFKQSIIEYFNLYPFNMGLYANIEEIDFNRLTKLFDSNKLINHFIEFILYRLSTVGEYEDWFDNIDNKIQLKIKNLILSQLKQAFKLRFESTMDTYLGVAKLYEDFLTSFIDEVNVAPFFIDETGEQNGIIERLDSVSRMMPDEFNDNNTILIPLRDEDLPKLKNFVEEMMDVLYSTKFYTLLYDELKNELFRMCAKEVIDYLVYMYDDNSKSYEDLNENGDYYLSYDITEKSDVKNIHDLLDKLQNL